MPYTNDADTGDFEKLQRAFQQVAQKFGSVDDVLEAFGLSEMPMAQRYGILFGFLTFVCTVGAVLVLLFLGGSFQRMSEQAETGEATILSAGEARSKRALLLEQLLEGRARMTQRYTAEPTTEQATPLTQMLLHEAPDAPIQVDENTTPKSNPTTKKEQERYIPPYYEANYLEAYRKCQDKPGGA